MDGSCNDEEDCEKIVSHGDAEVENNGCNDDDVSDDDGYVENDGCNHDDDGDTVEDGDVCGDEVENEGCYDDDDGDDDLDVDDDQD